MFQLKRISTAGFALSAALLFSVQLVSAQQRIPEPRDSQKSTVSQTVGATDISITYSRPAVKGRQLWGDPVAGSAPGEATLDGGTKGPLVPNGHVWRSGANEATLFVINDDVLINGQPLAAGKYSLHTIPAKDEWTIIFNKDDGQWGSFSYDATKDALRVKAKPVWTTDSQEFLTYSIDPAAFDSKKDAAGSATVSLRWEKMRLPFTVEVRDIPTKAMAKIRTMVAGAKSDDVRTPFTAANYAKANKMTDDAGKWYAQSLSAIDEQIKAKETFQNLQQKASILLAMNRNSDALAAAERAVVVGKAAGGKAEDIAALEKRIADMKGTK